MYKLYGITREICYDDHTATREYVDISNLIATFDTEELAEEYVEKSKLKQRTRSRIFCLTSLLSSYLKYEIQEVSKKPLHNPEI